MDDLETSIVGLREFAKTAAIFTGPGGLLATREGQQEVKGVAEEGRDLSRVRRQQCYSRVHSRSDQHCTKMGLDESRSSKRVSVKVLVGRFGNVGRAAILAGELTCWSAPSTPVRERQCYTNGGKSPP